MTAGVWVTADRTRVVEEGSPEAAFRLHLRDAEALGLLAEPEPEPEPKQVKRVADKARRRPSDK